MEIALLKLFLAHIIGDFFLQPDTWVEEKERKKLKSDKLYLHIAIHIALIFIVFASFSVWKLAFVVGIGHGIIDAMKLTFQLEKTKRKWFFADQMLHVALIFVCWHNIYEPKLNLSFLQDTKLWLFTVGALFLTTPAAIFIRVIIAKWIPSQPSNQISTTSLQDAGKFIGIMERLLIYLFVCTNHFEAVGFLLAAKSIFRFGDLKEAQDIKLTEYVLIGTLLSFGIALVVALGVLKINL
jgi:magnesium-transporting ATPase (P-type)